MLGCKNLVPETLSFKHPKSGLRGVVQDIVGRLEKAEKRRIREQQEKECEQLTQASVFSDKSSAVASPRYPTPKYQSWVPGPSTPKRDSARKFGGLLFARAEYESTHRKVVLSFDFEDLRFRQQKLMGTVDLEYELQQCNKHRNPVLNSHTYAWPGKMHAIPDSRMALGMRAVNTHGDPIEDVLNNNYHSIYPIDWIYRSHREAFLDFRSKRMERDAKAKGTSKVRGKGRRKVPAYQGRSALARNAQYAPELRKS